MGRRVVAADGFVVLLQDVLAFFSGNALHEHSRSGAPPVEQVAARRGIDDLINPGQLEGVLGAVLVEVGAVLGPSFQNVLPPPMRINLNHKLRLV
jgi:hypothetical protein